MPHPPQPEEGGDMPMSKDANIDLLQNIVKDQRKIITKVTGKKISATPQVVRMEALGSYRYVFNVEVYGHEYSFSCCRVNKRH